MQVVFQDRFHCILSCACTYVAFILRHTVWTACCVRLCVEDIWLSNHLQHMQSVMLSFLKQIMETRDC